LGRAGKGINFFDIQMTNTKILLYLQKDFSADAAFCPLCASI
jgi:hypothetical protein